MVQLESRDEKQSEPGLGIVLVTLLPQCHFLGQFFANFIYSVIIYLDATGKIAGKLMKMKVRNETNTFFCSSVEIC